jgi:hypothetical protein
MAIEGTPFQAGVDPPLRRMAVTAFVSYSWEHDPSHREWVRDLATRLRADGIDVKLDQWHAVPGDQLPHFMESAIRNNDFVVVICTPEYKKKTDQRSGGVGYEGDIMAAEIAARQNQRKFIPVLRKGEWEVAAPSWMLGKYYIDMRLEFQGYSDLRSTLLGARAPAPPLGITVQSQVPGPATQNLLVESLVLADATQWIGNILNICRPSSMYLGERRRRLEVINDAIAKAHSAFARYAEDGDRQWSEAFDELMQSLTDLARQSHRILPELNAPPPREWASKDKWDDWFSASTRVGKLLPASGGVDSPLASLMAANSRIKAEFSAIQQHPQRLYSMLGFESRQAFLDYIDPPLVAVMRSGGIDCVELLSFILERSTYSGESLIRAGFQWRLIDLIVNSLQKEGFSEIDLIDGEWTFTLNERGRQALPFIVQRFTRKQ